MAKPWELPQLVDEAKRYMVYSYGEWVGTYDTAAEVWAVIAKWDVDQARVYDEARIVSREQIEKEASGK